MWYIRTSRGGIDLLGRRFRPYCPHRFDSASPGRGSRGLRGAARAVVGQEARQSAASLASGIEPEVGRAQPGTSAHGLPPGAGLFLVAQHNGTHQTTCGRARLPVLLLPVQFFSGSDWLAAGPGEPAVARVMCAGVLWTATWLAGSPGTLACLTSGLVVAVLLAGHGRRVCASRPHQQNLAMAGRQGYRRM